MKKIYENIIFIGFISFFTGGLLLVFGQFIGLIINNPDIVLFAEKMTKFIFPAASISGLLCFLHPYIFKKTGKA